MVRIYGSGWRDVRRLAPCASEWRWRGDASKRAKTCFAGFSIVVNSGVSEQPARSASVFSARKVRWNAGLKVEPSLLR
ncbi:hypothetical protein QF000_004496 [Paraburkholderia atlantica]|uniref:Uncharacterized protein n=1 Tax=Paraburkholderia atlantica TaxID=2654982 RepID=A0A7W8V4T4_PARAM|nr:hypothetical protein [Paraburkholderia atlantica]